jgi:hypothetical protein
MEMFTPDRSGVVSPMPALAGGPSASDMLAAMGPPPRPMSPHEASIHQWYRELFRLALPDHASRTGSR